jgi:hypothetical protein
MARLPKTELTPGGLEKPANLSPRAAVEWDRLVKELAAAGVIVSTGHRALVSQAATIAADIADAWEVVEAEGAYTVNKKTGTPVMHPAAKRLDVLRRDHLKVLGQIGLRGSAVKGKPSRSLDELLND